jgi:hypothetical protein
MGPAVNEPPLREMAVQPVPQVAVTPLKSPARVTVLLEIVEPIATDD